MRRLRTSLLNACLLLIPLLAFAWLLIVQPAHAQYPGGTGGSNSSGNGGNPNVGWNDGNPPHEGTNSGDDTGYPGSDTGSNTGYPGSTDGSNTGSNTGYPGGNTGNNDGQTGIVGGNNGSNNGYPGGNTGSNTGYPGGDTGGNNTGSNMGSNTGYPGGGTNGNNTGYPGGTGGSNTGYPGGTGGNNTGSNSGYPGSGGGTDGNNTGGSGTGGTGTGGGGGTIVPGHWDVSYSNQSATTTWDYLADARAVLSGHYTWAPTASGDGTSDSTYLDAGTTGTVTATLTWVPTTGQDATSDPPSSCVIVTETGSAGAFGWGNGPATADDGWHDAQGQGGASSGTPSGPAWGSAFSSGTHYEVKDGSSGTITVGPFTLSAATPPNTTPDAIGNFSALGATASVQLNVAGNSATIGFTGTSTDDVDGSKKVLTGQGITAHLDGAPANVTSYKWSFSGGTPIKDWVPTWPNFPVSNSHPNQTVPLTDADEKGTDKSGKGISVAPISFYYTKAGSLTVTCDVTTTSADGTTTTKTIQSPSITYIKPSVEWSVGISFNKARSGFVTDQSPGAFGANEIWGPVAITEPAPFAGKGYGTGCFVQIASPLDGSWTRVPTNNNPITTYSKIQTMAADGTYTMLVKPMGLDADFPFPIGYYPIADPNNDDPNNWVLTSSAYTWSTSTSGYSVDAASQSYALSVDDSGGNDWRTSTASDTFNTWVMYQPPPKDGQGTIYVPLQKLKWVWGGKATRDSSTSPWVVQQIPQFNKGNPGNADDYPVWDKSIPYHPSVGP